MVFNNQHGDCHGDKEESWGDVLKVQLTGSHWLDVGGKGEEGILGNSQFSYLAKSRQGRDMGIWVGKCWVRKTHWVWKAHRPLAGGYRCVGYGSVVEDEQWSWRPRRVCRVRVEEHLGQSCGKHQNLRGRWRKERQEPGPGGEWPGCQVRRAFQEEGDQHAKCFRKFTCVIWVLENSPWVWSLIRAVERAVDGAFGKWRQQV